MASVSGQAAKSRVQRANGCPLSDDSHYSVKIIHTTPNEPFRLCTSPTPRYGLGFGGRAFSSPLLRGDPSPLRHEVRLTETSDHHLLHTDLDLG